MSTTAQKGIETLIAIIGLCLIYFYDISGNYTTLAWLGAQTIMRHPYANILVGGLTLICLGFGGDAVVQYIALATGKPTWLADFIHHHPVWSVVIYLFIVFAWTMLGAISIDFIEKAKRTALIVFVIVTAFIPIGQPCYGECTDQQ